MEGHIRPFVESDILQVAALHNKIWKLEPTLSAALMKEYQNYFSGVFLRQPWGDGPLCSLVHEETDGRITGFMGSVPRRLHLNGTHLQMRIASQFFVDPGRRGFAGIQLARSFMEGPQDISFTDEANASARLIWERLGATVCSFSSLRWIAVLRPCRFALLALRKYGLGMTPIRAMSPLAAVVDSAVSRLPKFPTRPATPRLSGEELECDTLVECLQELSRRKVLQPVYDAWTVRWLLDRAAFLQSSGKLQKVLIRSRSGEVAGWYVYYLNPHGISDVVSLHARDQFAHDVVEHLFHHAWHRGATVLLGRPETALMRALSDKQCLFYSSRRQWMLVHSKQSDLLHAFASGEVCFPRLEGEWCLHFR